MILNLLIFLVVSGGMLVGGYFLLKKFSPTVADQIRETIDGLLAKFKK